ncbi:hypothetical protein EUX98_g7998 [Antrodiella citrinella]|uniref:Uncharacterized protein n=1 Tax=Antrodiella citrinella TaxID=2447956 RepID=A0A4S4MCF4_9APHY|nr:hypothetical protein EUX98_g7998 [Antrodiella citrinella]
MNPPPSPFTQPQPQTPTFGRIQNVPFIFNTPPPQVPHAPAWVPPKAPRLPEPELRDVDMGEASPPARLQEQAAVGNGVGKKGSRHVEEEEGDDGERVIATGGLKRVFKSRQKAQRERSRLAVVVRRGRSRGHFSDDEHSGSDDDRGDEDEEEYEVVRNTSNHYTLNVPAPAPPKSDTPYILLG